MLYYGGNIMKFAKLLCTYIIAGAATAIGWKIIENLGSPYNKVVFKQKFNNIKNAIKRR